MTRFYIENAEEFDRACRLLDKRDVPYDIDGGDHYRRRPNCSVGYALRCKGKEGA